jgi:hypothetical protein
MSFALLRRSLVAAATISMLTIPHAFAENVDADRDLLTPLPQSSIDFGTVEAGGSRAVDVYFLLTCSGTNHVNSDQFVKLTVSTKSTPTGGFATVPGLTFGLGDRWPADGDSCPTELAPTIGGPIHITVVAPTTPGSYRYFFAWSMAVTPSSADDNGVFGLTKPSFEVLLNVPGGTPTNTPPTLNLPADSTVEGNTTGGAKVTYTATASDAEDATAPVPSCSPASGSTLPLGPNTINCTVTDGGGLTTTGTFKITVADRTPPTLSGRPGDMWITTANPAGVTLTYTPPTASDIVDPSPSVSCSPASGKTIPVGDTTVSCTATDQSGKSASASFQVHVKLASALWDDPIGASAGIVVNGARTVPVKVQLLVGGQPVVTGDGRLDVVPCGGGPAVMTDDLAVQSNGRWMGHLDTSGLTPGCYQVVASVDAQAIGSFRMDVRGDATGASKPAAKPVIGKPTKP